MDFSKKPETADNILQLISTVPSGKAILSRFMPRLSSGRVRIDRYPLQIIERLRTLIGDDQPIGACFVNDGYSGTIYLDLESPLGVLAPFLLHEIVHSLDEHLWKAAREPKSSASAHDRLMLRAEGNAFASQHQFVDELATKFPEYRRFLHDQYPKAKILHDRLTSTEIADLYGFKVS